MKLLRILRGIGGTALSFTLPWAAVGAVLAVVWELVSPTVPPPLVDVNFLLDAAASGATLVGMLGTAVGAGFATALAISARRLAFEQLAPRGVFALGIVGGGLVAGSLLTLFSGIGGWVWPTAYSLQLVVSAGLGGASAWAMLRIARQSSAQNPLSRLAHGNDMPHVPERESVLSSRGTT